MIKLRVIPGSLLLLALLLRLTFVLGLQESPLYWDEPYYNASANRYRDAWNSVFNPEPTIPLLHKAFKGSLQKGESYSMTVGMIYAVFGPRPRVVFLFQAILDTLTCLFIYGLSSRLGGPWVGLIALALATVYEPFIFSSARLQTETFATFLYIGGLWFAFASPSRRRGMFGLIGGFLIALSTLAKPALQFLFPLLVPAMALSGFSGSWRLSARLTLALVRLLSLPRLLSLMPLLDPKGAYGLRTGTIAFLIVLVFVSVVWVLCGVLSTRRAMAAMGVPLVLTVLVFLGGRPHYHVWREWWCPLSVGRGVIRQEFVLPEGLGSPNRAELKLDLLPGQTGDYDLVVRVNGREMRRYYGEPRGKDADLPKEDYYEILYELWHFYEEPVHAWYTIPLSPEIVSSGNRLEVEVWVEGKTGSVTVFGDYPAPENSYDGPSPFSPELLADTSIYRYLGTGDFRMRRRIKPGGSSRSAFYTGGDWSYEDLCLEPGRRYGRYRIFLVLTHGDRLMVF